MTTTIETAGESAAGRPPPAFRRRDAYPLPEVAERLGGISRRSVYNLLDSGRLRSVKIAGRRLVTAEDLAAFVAAAMEAA